MKNIYCVKFNADISTSISKVNCLRQRNMQLKQEAILLPKNVLDMHLNSRLTTKKYVTKKKSWSIYFLDIRQVTRAIMMILTDLIGYRDLVK